MSALRQRDKEKLIPVYRRAGKNCVATTDEAKPSR